MAEDNLITTIGIGIEAKTDQAVKGINDVTNALKGLGNVKGATIPKTVVSRLNELSEAMSHFKNIGRFNPAKTFDDIANSVQKLSNLGKVSISKTLASRITDIGESLKTLKGVDITPLEKFADVLGKLSTVSDTKVPKLTGVTNAVRGARSVSKAESMGSTRNESRLSTGTFGEMRGADLNIDNLRDKIISLDSPMKRVNITSTRLGQTLEHGLANGLRKAGSAMGKLALNLAVAPFKKLGNAVSGAISRLTGFLSAIKRIAVYRAIRTALKEITQGFREGMQNLYQYSLLIDGKFKDSMDSLATSALYLKNSLGAMVAPIINALAPAVDYLVDKFVDLLNTFNELIATLTGASTWTKALKYPKAYAEEADKASGSAKKLRATLLGFDEINRLDDNSKGGRGSGTEPLDYSKMFEEQDVSESARAWADRLKQAIAGEGDSIGSVIGDTITSAIDNYSSWINNVDWKGIGVSVGDNLNDAIKHTDSKKMGKALADTINAGFKTLNGFTSTVDWNAFGDFLANGINGFFDGIGTQDIADTISNGIAGALKMAGSFLKTTDVEKIGTKVGDLVKGLNWSNIFDGLGQFIEDAINFKNDLWKAGRAIGDKVKDSLLSAIRELPEFGEKIVRAVITGMADHFVDVFHEALNIGDKIYEAIKGKFWKLREKGGKEMVLEIIEGIKAKLQEIWDWGVSVAKKFLDGIKYGLTHSQLIKDVKEKIVEVFKNRGGLVNEDVYTVIGADNPSHNALGGEPQTGSLFYANEHGVPELVTNLGNKSQVANPTQITDAIRLATQDGNAESNGLLRQAVSLLNGILQKDNTVVAEITTDSITSGLRRQNLRNGVSTVAVGG